MENFASYLKHPIFKVVSQIATEENLQVYVIGGFVRDIFLARERKDIDIVVVGNGMDLAQKAATILRVKKVSLFKNFGTAAFRYKDIDVEFVGARKESYVEESRKPTVESGSLIDDQNRRDFTINALGISLHKDTFGELMDPFNGIEDLENGIIRTPLDPDITFSDDPLRMMRAVRFASQLDFQIEHKTREALLRNSERLKIISHERIMDEFNKIMMSKTPSRGLKILFSTHLLHQFFPELVNLAGVETRDGKSHKDNFYHTLEVIDNVAENSDDLWLRWAALMHDIAKPPTKRFDKTIGWTFHGHEDLGAKWTPKIFTRLKLPLDHKMKFVQKLVRLHLRPISLVKGSVTDSAIRRLLFEAGDDVDDLMTLCNADITSKNEFKVKRFRNNFELVREKLKTVEEKDKVRNFQPPINGGEIMEIFQLKPCNTIGELKIKIKDAILEGQIQNDRIEAYNYLLTLANEMQLEVKKTLEEI